MIDETERGPAANASIRRNGAAYLVSKTVKSACVPVFANLGMEAIHESVVQDMPVTVAVDATCFRGARAESPNS